VSNSNSNTQTSKALLIENRRIAQEQGDIPERENKIETADILIYSLYSSSNHFILPFILLYSLSIWSSSQLAY
jgi:hypothetical protein